MRAEDDVPLAALKTKPAAAKKRKAPAKDSKKKKKKKTSSSAKVRAPPAAARRPVCSRGPSLSAGRAATQGKGKGKAKAKPAKKKSKPKGKTPAKKKKSTPSKKAAEPKQKFDLVGQIKARPDDEAAEFASFEALRIFHTTNFTENGKSEMSAKWCMERGLLKPEFQKKWHKYFERQKAKGK